MSSECFLEWCLCCFEEEVHLSGCSPRASCFSERSAGGSVEVRLWSTWPICFLFWVLAFQLPSSAGSSVFLAILLSAGMLRHVFSHFAFCFGCQLLATLIGGLKHLFSYFALGRDAQPYFQPFCLVKTTSEKVITRHMLCRKIIFIDRESLMSHNNTYAVDEHYLY